MMKRDVEKDMLTRGLRRTDVEDRSVWKLGCKNLITSARRRYFSTLLEQMNDDGYFKKCVYTGYSCICIVKHRQRVHH